MKPLYIQMFSIHGLLRSENMEMGRDADTGGQIKYVVELAKALSHLDAIERVDLFTRMIVDKTVSEDYGLPLETVNAKFRIVRIQCGGRKYIRKELLWPHLDEFVDKVVKYIRQNKRIPDIVHGHYADAGYVASQLGKLFGIPFVFTGHSLGRPKREKLVSQGMTEADINKQFKMDHRIRIEEDVLKEAELVVTSTNQEIEQQYGMYQCKSMSVFHVIPPGVEIEKFYPYYHDVLLEGNRDENQLYAQASIRDELERFYLHPDKPLILTLCRPEKRKNISGLIKAYGQDKDLQIMANLAIFAGIRKDISDKQDNEKEVLTQMLLLMDKYDLYGKMAIPKRHDFEYEVPELYRFTAGKRGVFCNIALTEPFGLTLIEAASVGLPVVATNDGGPKDIIGNCQCGILVDPNDTKEISTAIRKLLSDTDLWKTYSKNGSLLVPKHYTWENHVKNYLKIIEKIDAQKADLKQRATKPQNAIGKRMDCLKHFIITDVDNTLTGGNSKDLKRLCKFLKENKDKIGFGVATGRTLESVTTHLKKNAIPAPDVIISSVGAELYYGKDLNYSKGWETHISKQWDRDKILGVLKEFNFLTYQEEHTQRKFKISFDMDPSKDNLARIHNALIRNKCRYTLIYSHDQFLDILPFRASKGKAIRYLSYFWDIPISNFLVCGDSGNDIEMLKGASLGVVVANYSKELEPLKNGKNIFFANRSYAGGIIEGLQHYRFVEKAHAE